jgi:hypothetical protein
MTGSPWPKCGMVIWKDGGCSHMNWQKCKFEFWWHCLGHYAGYVHRETTYWPLRAFITFLSSFLMLLSVDVKLWRSLPIIGTWQFFVLYWIWAVLKYFIFPNAFVLCFGFTFLLIALVGNACNPYSSTPYISRLLLVIVAIVYPVIYLYLWYKIYYSVMFNFMLWWIYYEFLLFVGGWALAGTIALIIYFGKSIIHVLFLICKSMVKNSFGVAVNVSRRINRSRQFLYTTKNERMRMNSVKLIKRNSNSFKKSR